MRALPALAAFLVAALVAGAVVAQSSSRPPSWRDMPTLPPNPSMNSAPNPGNDEVAARRRLEDAGYTDIQGLSSNGDGTFSGRAIRGRRGFGYGREVRVDIDTRGHIREW
jgi:hypothetical protein